MKDEFDSLNILAHESAKPKVEYLTRELYIQAGRRFDRRPGVHRCCSTT